jgi:hypothetical protein
MEQDIGAGQKTHQHPIGERSSRHGGRQTSPATATRNPTSIMADTRGVNHGIAISKSRQPQGKEQHQPLPWIGGRSSSWEIAAEKKPDHCGEKPKDHLMHTPPILRR